MKFRRPELLLHPNIPKPLHGCAPRVVLGDRWWNQQRKIAYAVNDYCCWACGVPKELALYHQHLEAHESYKIDYKKGRMWLEEIVALCHLCHNFIHSGRLEMRLNEGQITQEFFDEVMDHGKWVLGKRRKKKEPKRCADWEDWRMVIEGKEYGPTSADYDAWTVGEWMFWRPKGV